MQQQWNTATHAEKFTKKPHSGGFFLPSPLNWIAFSAGLLLAYGNYRSGQTAIAAKAEGYFKLAVRLYFVAWLGFAVWRVAQRLWY